MLIVPAVFQDNFEQVVHELFIFEGLCERVQIDLCDGVFGAQKTWLPYQEESLPIGFAYEFDLMVTDWRKYLSRAIKLKAQRVVMHVDNFSDDDITEMIEMIKPHFIYLGLSVSNDIDMAAFVDRVHLVLSRYSKVFIQVMGIRHIGIQGQPFDEASLKRVEYFRNHLRHIEIQVDGSMNNETILKVLNRGAACAVVGSYLFKETSTRDDVEKQFKKLEESFR